MIYGSLFLNVNVLVRFDIFLRADGAAGPANLDCLNGGVAAYPEDGGEMFVKQAIEAHANEETFYFGILADGELIGAIDLRSIESEKRTVECGYAIAASHWGKGIATIAVALALRYAFCELRVDIVFAHCLKRNPASARVLEKNGFRETGDFASDLPKFKDEPSRAFQLTKQEWFANRSTEDGCDNS